MFLDWDVGVLFDFNEKPKASPCQHWRTQNTQNSILIERCSIENRHATLNMRQTISTTRRQDILIIVLISRSHGDVLHSGQIEYALVKRMKYAIDVVHVVNWLRDCPRNNVLLRIDRDIKVHLRFDATPCWPLP